MTRRADLAAFMVGLSSLWIQAVLIRRLMAAFGGNELTIGLCLAAWMAATGAGALLGARLTDRAKSPANWLALVLAAAAALVIPALLATADIKSRLGLAPGEIAGVLHLLAASLLITAPPALLLGAAFNLAARLQPDPSAAAGRAYRFEAVGAFTAGLVLAVWLSRRADPIMPGAAITLVLGLAGLVQIKLHDPPGRAAAGAAALVTVTAIFCILDTVRGGPVGRAYEARYWAGREALESFDSRDGYLAAVRTGGEVTIFTDGIPAATFPDPAHDEVLAHLPMIMGDRPPGRVLVIGGGFTGLARELLRHPLERLDYVQHDPGWIELERRWAPGFAAAAGDGRVRMFGGDGRRRLRAGDEVYDLVIVDLPDPYTAGLERYYTVEFYDAVRGALAPGGVLAFTAGTTPPNRSPSPAELGLLAGAVTTARQVFGRVEVLPVGANLIIAGDTLTRTTTDPAEIDRRLAGAGIESYYAGSGLIGPDLAPGLMAELREKIAGAGALVDRDLRPRGYWYGVMAWAERASPGTSALIRRAGSLPGWTLGFLPAGVLVLGLGLAARDRTRAEPLTAAVVSGLVGTVIEVMLLLAYQVAEGSVYFALALLTGCFMAGLAAGAGAAERWPTRWPLRSWEAALVGWSAIVIIVTGRSAGWQPGGLAGLAIFGTLLFGQGGVAGGMFAAASARVARAAGTGTGAGLVYGIEMAGASLGGLLACAALAPLFGTMWALAGAMFAALALLAVGMALDMYQR